MESVFKFWKNVERKAQELIPLQVFPAQVKEVDENNRTCTVRVNDNVDLYEVKLYAVTDKDLKGFCLLPAKDSQVLVARIANGNDLFVCLFSVVDKVVGTVGSDTSIDVTEDEIKINAKKIEFNGGKNGGLAIAEKIETNLGKITTYLDNMNTAISTALKAVGTVTGVVNGAGAAQGYDLAMESLKIEFDAMENDKIKH